MYTPFITSRSKPWRRSSIISWNLCFFKAKETITLFFHGLFYEGNGKHQNSLYIFILCSIVVTLRVRRSKIAMFSHSPKLPLVLLKLTKQCFEWQEIACNTGMLFWFTAIAAILDVTLHTAQKPLHCIYFCRSKLDKMVKWFTCQIKLILKALLLTQQSTSQVLTQMTLCALLRTEKFKLSLNMIKSTSMVKQSFT